MFIVRKNLNKIRVIQKKLSEYFKIETLGPVYYFLSIKITRDRQKKTIILSQEAYIDKILNRFSITDYKLVITSIVTGTLKFIVPNTE